MTQDFDLLVLGGGPGGYVAALRAAQLGLKTALVEKEFLGGVCLNRGCIPSKTLLAGTELFTKIEKAKDWGIELSSPPLWNKKRLFEKKDEVILKMRKGLEALCEKKKVLRVTGTGKLIGAHEVSAGKEKYSAKNIILATGSVPKRIDFGIGDRSKIFSSEEALDQSDVPRSILILGGGPEGCEFALIYSGLGTKVIVIEAKERLLPGFDRDAGAALKRVLLSKSIEVYTGETVAKVLESSKMLEIELSGGQNFEVEAILGCAGRAPNTHGLGLESLGVKLSEKKAISVDALLRTNVDSIYAVGDVTGNLMMAHSASYEGYRVAGNLAGEKRALDYSAVPSCVYTYPEVAEVGLNEEKAKEKNIPYEIGRFSFMMLGRSQAKGETEGFVKIIGHAKTNEVLGGVIVGAGAAELVNIFSLAIKNKLKAEDLRGHIAPHPSASEAVVEATHLFFKEGLHYA